MTDRTSNEEEKQEGPPPLSARPDPAAPRAPSAPSSLPPRSPPAPPAPAAAPADKAKRSGRIGRPPGTTEQKVLQQAMVILELKARGNTDDAIKKALGLRERDYERRLKALRENKLLARQAQGAVQEIVLRLFATRNHIEAEMKNLGKKEHFHRVKHAALILDAEREILSISKQLGYWPPPVEASLDAEKIAEKTGEAKDQDPSGLPPLESLTDEQLQQFTDSLVQKA